LRRRRRFRPGIGPVILALGAASAFLLALFVPTSEEENHRIIFDFRPALEILILIGAVGLLRLIGLRLPALLRYAIALLVLLAALLNLADAVMPGAYGRAVDLYWDLRLVPDLLGIYAKSAGFWSAILLAGTATLAALGGFLLIALSLRVIEWATEGRAVALAVVALAALACGIVASPREPNATAPINTALSAQLTEQSVLLYRAWQVAHGRLGDYAGLLAAPQRASADLVKLKHRDVLLIFVESFGTVVLDNPHYRARITPALARFEATLETAGIGLVSNRVLSPSFGGGSWISHGTLLGGIKLDQFLSRLVLESGRKSLPRYMAEAGYRTVDVEPGIKYDATDSAFWGFEKNYYSADLDYRGPEFGWFGIPDQFTMKKFATRENTRRAAGDGSPERKPLFAQIVLVSSHTPFHPVPPYRKDWADAGDYIGVTPQDWERIYRQPDWSHLEEPFLDSLGYVFDVLGDFMATRVAEGALVFILGDEQPPAFISGENQPWTVPIYALSRDPDLLAPFVALGYRPGAFPEQAAPWRGTESFLADFLDGFSSDGDERKATPSTAASLQGAGTPAALAP
jgi:hypothetical protein